ncbi:MAG: TrmH family RNA methyltransferase [Bacilli bacterium]|nr:TrmH family RNA methyltransferase [Bacilli bacterium]
MKKYEKNGTVSYCLGTTLVFELLNRKPEAATKIYISPKQNRDETYTKLVTLAKSHHLPVIENNEKIFKELSDKDNVMAIGEFNKFSDTLIKDNPHLVLVNPSNMGNLGTIIRCMAGFGVLDLAIIRPAADIFDPKVVRSSMGAIFSIRFHYFDTFGDYQKEYGNHHMYPFMLQAKFALQEAKIEKPYSIVLGNEATGLDRSFLDVGTPLIIPHSKLIDSLNLDNAAAIALYEFTK